MTNMEGDERKGDETHAILPAHLSPSASDNCNSAQSSNAASTTEGGMVLCNGCQQPIYDKYYMWVDKRSWHEACVQCNVCHRLLVKSCYSKNHKLYCPQDYKLLQKCRRCLRIISFNEYVLHVSGMPYHVNCFSCDFCHHHLQSGDQYLVDETTNQVYCKSCYAQTDPMSSHYVQDDNIVSDSERSDDDVFPHHAMSGLSHMTGYVPPGMDHTHGLLRTKHSSKGASSLSLIATSSDGKRVKRPRTILTTAQRRKFKASFEVSQKPCRKVRETLAAETGLSPRVVQVWFQNQRAKMKKLARRQQGDGTGQGVSRDGNRTRRKKTTDSDSDNDEISSAGSYASTPTPHQTPLYPDIYRSPGSIQTSPTTSTSEVNPYYPPPPPSNHHDLSEIMYEDFESNLLSSSDAFMTQAQHTVSSSANAVSLHTEVRLQPDPIQPINEYGRVHMTMESDTGTVSSPHGTFPQLNVTQPLMHYPNQAQDGNPIDRLMYMQNNFFRT